MQDLTLLPLHRPAVSQLLSGTLYEPDTHAFVEDFFSDLDGSMIHAGTFYGDMIPTFAKAVAGTVYAFEPVFENYVLDRLCVDQNDLRDLAWVRHTVIKVGSARTLAFLSWRNASRRAVTISWSSLTTS